MNKTDLRSGRKCNAIFLLSLYSHDISSFKLMKTMFSTQLTSQEWGLCNGRIYLLHNLYLWISYVASNVSLKLLIVICSHSRTPILVCSPICLPVHCKPVLMACKTFSTAKKYIGQITKVPVPRVLRMLDNLEYTHCLYR